MLATTALAVAAASLVLPGRATAAEPGFEVRITELPATFGAGAESRTLTVVASTDRARCQKVRWSLILRVQGPELDEAEVERVEENGSFPVRVQTDDDVARITDVQLDPGQLCRGRTVTARYRISFDDDADTGRVTFQPQAFSAGGTLLQEASGQSPVVGQKSSATESPTGSPTGSPTTAPTGGADEADDPEYGEAGDEATATPEPAPSEDDLAAVPASADGSSPSLLIPGLIVGAVLVFVGVALLIRLRSRTPKHSVATGFHPSR
ncbi:hypothetical protein Asp14428_77900 [Actinoplanes sp. NBRC 14428]|nr:hypothetical protein Asp14428_77900 [Actinoplanes sp. NBRC 14428]